MSDDLNKLSRETDLVMKILSSLEKERRQSKAEEGRADDNTVSSEPEPAPVDLDRQHLVGVRLISRRDEIPISENHVLVMWGLSTYRFEHPLGVTFAVNNSRSNNTREKQHREAQLAAMESAHARGLSFIYILR